AWRPVDPGRNPTGGLNSGHRHPRVGPKLRRRQFVDKPVSVAMAGDLMASIGNLPNQRWKPLCNPAEYEKSAFNLFFFKDFEGRMNLRPKPRRECSPIALTHPLLNFGGVEVLLDVDRYGVHHRGAYLPVRRVVFLDKK